MDTFTLIGSLLSTGLGAWVIASGVAVYKHGPRYRIVDKSDPSAITEVRVSVKREVLLGLFLPVKIFNGYFFHSRDRKLAEARRYLNQIANEHRHPSIVFDSKLDGIENVLSGEIK